MAAITIASRAATHHSRKANTFRRTDRFFLRTREPLTGEAKHGIGAQGSYFYNTRRFVVGGQLEHYDRGFRMDTAFINRVGLTRGWQYQDLNFYPHIHAVSLDQTDQSVLLGDGGKGSRAGGDRSLLPSGASIQLHARRLSAPRLRQRPRDICGTAVRCRQDDDRRRASRSFAG